MISPPLNKIKTSIKLKTHAFGGYFGKLGVCQKVDFSFNPLCIFSEAVCGEVCVGKDGVRLLDIRPVQTSRKAIGQNY